MLYSESKYRTDENNKNLRGLQKYGFLNVLNSIDNFFYKSMSYIYRIDYEVRSAR